MYNELTLRNKKFNMCKISFWTLVILILNSKFYSEAKPKKLNILPSFILKSIKHKADHILEVAGENNQCAKDLKRLFNDAVHVKRWALEMLDSTAKFTNGILAGNIYMNGNFDECLDINEVKNNETIRGQYCTVLLTPTDTSGDYLDFSSVATMQNYMGIKTSTQTSDVLKTFKISYGVCIPDSCSIGNLQKLWDYVEHTFRLPVHFNFYDTMCSTRLKGIEPYDFDVFVYAFFGLYIVILLLATGYDVFFYQNKTGKDNSIWISFSIFTNAKKLFKISEGPEEYNYLSAISGIKVICMLWILYGHRVVLNLFSGAINLIYLTQWKSQVFTSIILSSSYAVDTFLMLSGFLLSFGCLSYQHSKTENITIPILPLYIYRFFRLSPGLIALILFNTSVYKNLNSGPIWPLQATKYARTCSKTWFPALFFLNNLIDVNYQCVEHAWYLAVDSQLYFMSPIVLTNMLRTPLKTVWASLGVCILSGIYTFFITIRNNYGAIFFESNKEYLTYIYQATMVRMPPWFIGIIFGYIIFKFRNIKLTKILNWLAWITAFSTLVALILVHLVFTTTNEYNALNAAIFNSCARQLWSIGIGLMLFLCTTNRDGIINNFLSMSIFRVMARISYSVYLVQGVVLFYFIGGKKHSTYFSDITNLHDFLGDILFVVVAAILWCLSFESPFIAVAKYLYKKEDTSQLFKNKTQKRKKNKKIKNNYLVCVYKYEEDKELSAKKIK